MEQEINTLELAKLYEKQGYISDAQKMYEVLHNQNPTLETQDGLRRTNRLLKSQNQGGESKAAAGTVTGQDMQIQKPAQAVVQLEQKLPADLKKWMTLVLMENRLTTARQMKQNCRPDHS